MSSRRHWIRNDLTRYIYSLLPDFFGPGYFTYWQFRNYIKKTEYFTRVQFEKMQFNHLKKIVNYAWENIGGYKEFWMNNDFNPRELRSIKDIEKIPFLTKDILIDNLVDFSNTKLKNIQHVTTGGSTGIPMGFYQQTRNSLIELAFIHDLWSRKYNRIHYKSKSTILRGNRTESIASYKPHVGLILSSYDINLENVKYYIELIEKYKTPILQAYPSALYLMAHFINENNLVIEHKFQAIMLGSEPLYPFQRNLIDKVFQTRISHWYGHSEKAVLAANCEHSDAFHIYPQYGVTELVSPDGVAVAAGQVGELVGTSFWNYATPLIRYRTNDFAVSGGQNCQHCKRNYPLLEKVEGRLHDFIVDDEGCLVTLTALIFAQHFDAFSNIRQMNLYQDTKGQVVVNVIPLEHFGERDKQEIVSKMEKATHNKIKVSIKLVKEVNLGNNGKSRFLDQKLEIKDYL